METLPYQVVNDHGPAPSSGLQLPYIPRPLSLAPWSGHNPIIKVLILGSGRGLSTLLQQASLLIVGVH